MLVEKHFVVGTILVKGCTYQNMFGGSIQHSGSAVRCFVSFQCGLVLRPEVPATEAGNLKIAQSG